MYICTYIRNNILKNYGTVLQCGGVSERFDPKILVKFYYNVSIFLQRLQAINIRRSENDSTHYNIVSDIKHFILFELRMIKL